jgi:glucosyl-3-phosphoglycerate phosphatase
MILLRHAQSLFNVSYAVTRVDPGIRDPELTELGREQARAAAEKLRSAPVKRLITSPYMRALQTTAIVQEILNLPVSVEPLVGERGAFVCDIGTHGGELARQWPDFDFSHMPGQWWSVEETEDALLGRCARFRSVMCAVADWPHVLVVTHWGFIRGLTGVTVQNAEAIAFDPTAPAVANPFAKQV